MGPYAPRPTASHKKFRERIRLQVECLERRDVPSFNSLAPMPPPWAQVFHGDFNGDGKQDVAGITSGGRWWVSLSTGTAFTARTQWGQWSVAGSWANLFVADVNGDGNDDIVGFGNTGGWFVGLSNGTDQFVSNSSAWARWSVSSTWRQLFVADFNGDNKADIAGFGNTGAWFVGLSNGTDKFAAARAWAHWSVSSTWNRLFVGDFNGDGKSDVAGFAYNGSWFVGRGNGTDTFTTGPRWAQWSPPIGWLKLLVADFSGDGKTDIAGVGVTGSVFVGLSNGADAFVTGPRWFRLGGDPTASYYTAFFAADIDGDGNSDLVDFGSGPNFGLGHYGAIESTWEIIYSNGLSAFERYDYVDLWPASNYFAKLFVTDFTGDGRADIGVLDVVDTPQGVPPSWHVGETPAGGGFGSVTPWVSW
jgi:FG-GAP-like repeat